MATLNLLVNPAGMVAGAQAGEDALEDVAIQAQKTESAVDRMGKSVGRSSAFAGNGMKGLAQQGSQVIDMGLATGQWGKAFFLQMSDIAMVLGGPLTIAIGSAIGVLGTLGLSFLNAENDVKSFDDALDDATDTLNEYRELSALTAGEGVASFKDVEASIRGASQATKDLLAIAKIEAFGSIDALNRSLSDSVLSASLLQGEVADVGDLLNIETQLRGNITVWKENRKEAAAFGDMLDRLGNGGPIEESLALARQIRDEFKANVDVTGDMTDAQIEFWRSISSSIAQMEVLVGTTEEAENATASIEAAYRRIAAEQTTVTAGTSEYLSDMASLFKTASDLREELGDAAFEALRLAEVDISSGISKAAEQAAILAGNLGISLNAAVSLQNLQDSKVYSGRGGDPRDFDGNSGTNLRNLKWINPDKKSAAAAKAARKAERASDAYDRLIASMDPVAAEELKIANAQEVVSEALSAGVISADQAADAYEQIEERMSSSALLFDDLAQIGGSALDQLIDGSIGLKDALIDVAKEMLNVILKQKLMEKVKGAGSGDSVGAMLIKGIFGGFFDNGGLLATGQTGIVGENGPERITSTTRGTVVTSRSQTAREGGSGGGVIMGEIGVSVDDDGKLQAYVKRMGVQAAQAGRALAVGDVRDNLSGWNQTLNTDGALA